MRICIQCLYTKSWLDIAKITVPNITAYCQKKGYSWNIQCIDEPYDAFEKIRQIQGLFERDEADVVMSMDCDTIITNYNRRIEDFIEDGKEFYITNDYNGVNTGIFLCVKSNRQKVFLEFLYSCKSFPEVYCEQNAIEKWLSLYPNDAQMKTLPHPSINSHEYSLYENIPAQSHEQGQWEYGDFILHLPGIGMEQRKQILSNTKVIYE